MSDSLAKIVDRVQAVRVTPAERPLAAWQTTIARAAAGRLGLAFDDKLAVHDPERAKATYAVHGLRLKAQVVGGERTGRCYVSLKWRTANDASNVELPPSLKQVPKKLLRPAALLAASIIEQRNDVRAVEIKRYNHRGLLLLVDPKRQPPASKDRRVPY